MIVSVYMTVGQWSDTMPLTMILPYVPESVEKPLRERHVALFIYKCPIGHQTIIQCHMPLSQRFFNRFGNAWKPQLRAQSRTTGPNTVYRQIIGPTQPELYYHMPARRGSDKTRGQGSFGPFTGGQDLQGSLQPAELTKKRTAYWIRLFY